jgi:uncharacterized protein YdhG (YjbR/CyaY superfamily)
MASNSQSSTGFSKEEQAAMKARAKELAAEQRANKKREDGEREVLEAISAMDGLDKQLAQAIHSLVLEVAPQLWSKTWYGMPAYAKDGKVICFFQAANKFGSRYATFGFNDAATLDKGTLWPTSFALTGLTPENEQYLREMIARAIE